MRNLKLLTAGILLSGIANVNAQQTIDNVKIGMSNDAKGVTLDVDNHFLVNGTMSLGGWTRAFWIGQEGNANTIAFGSYGDINRTSPYLLYSFIGKNAIDTHMVFLPNKNIGIGTNTPTARLDVSGDIKTNDLTIFNYSPLLTLKRSTNIGGYIEGIQTQLNDGTNNWYFGNIDTDRWIVSKGDYQNAKLTVRDNGSVGIGTVSPSEKLDVLGNIAISSGYSIKSNGRLHITANENLYLLPQSGVKITRDMGGSGTLYVEDKVGIGSQNPDEKLTVKGKIHAEEVRVDLQVPADYVFEKYYSGASTLKADYTMLTLAEVEKYTKENNHLPNVPSAKEIQEKGLQVGEMTNILLQKIEELTLYTIEQQKRIEALEAKLTGKK